MSNRRIIGIVGGVGPYAGVDLAQKIFDQTNARADQEHLPVALLSVPGEIADRTAFILGETATNPAHALAEIIQRLERMGASVVGIPCNTAHAPQIFDVIIEKLAEAGCNVKLVHMIERVARFIREKYPRVRKVAVLSTTGTNKANVYPHFLEKEGIEVLSPSNSLQDNIHAAVYDPEYGIKARSNPVTETARAGLMDAIAFFQNEGAEAIILGCTEIPIAIRERKIGGMPIIDSTLILARALIDSVAPEKLRPCGE